MELKRAAALGAQDQAAPLLEIIYRQTGHRWERLSEVPEPVPAEGWLEPAKEALRRFWEAKRAKRREIDESIQWNAPQETLYDCPEVVPRIVRVCGPFTVEAIPVPAVEDPTQVPIPQLEDSAQEGRVSDRGGDYLTTMLSLLKQQGGVLFPGGKKMEIQNLRPLNVGYLHAEGETKQNGKPQWWRFPLGRSMVRLPGGRPTKRFAQLAALAMMSLSLLVSALKPLLRPLSRR